MKGLHENITSPRGVESESALPPIGVVDVGTGVGAGVGSCVGVGVGAAVGAGVGVGSASSHADMEAAVGLAPSEPRLALRERPSLPSLLAYAWEMGVKLLCALA